MWRFFSPCGKISFVEGFCQIISQNKEQFLYFFYICNGQENWQTYLMKVFSLLSLSEIW